MVTFREMVQNGDNRETTKHSNKELELLSNLGFHDVTVSVAGESVIGECVFGRLSEKPVAIQGSYSTKKEYELLVSKIDWYSGPLVFLRKTSPKYVLFEKFFCLDSTDLPSSLLSYRDYFDYDLEASLKRHFQSILPMIGPSWSYIYECDAVQDSIQRSRLLLRNLFVGNAVMCRSDDLKKLVNQQEEVKDHIQESASLPILWGYPKELPLDAKDNLFEPRSRKWYTISITSDLPREVSLVDLVQHTPHPIELTVHDFVSEGTQQREISSEHVDLHLSEIGGQFRVKKKLSELSISFGWA